MATSLLQTTVYCSPGASKVRTAKVSNPVLGDLILFTYDKKHKL